MKIGLAEVWFGKEYGGGKVVTWKSGRLSTIFKSTVTGSVVAV